MCMNGIEKEMERQLEMISLCMQLSSRGSIAGNLTRPFPADCATPNFLDTFAWRTGDVGDLVT